MFNLQNPFHLVGDVPDIPGLNDPDLTDDERGRAAVASVLGGCLTMVLTFAVLFTLCLLFGSCTTTRYVPVENRHNDTIRVVQIQRDSIFVGSVQRDSISLTQRGDTITIDRWHTRLVTQYRDRVIHDTTYVATHDTIPQVVYEEKEVQVQKPLTRWQRYRLSLANILLTVLGIYVAVWLIRKRNIVHL